MSEFINKVWCPKCGYCSGDDWKQCNGLCPMKGSPHYDEKLAAAYGPPKPTPPTKRECVVFSGYEAFCLRCGKGLDDHPPKDWPDMTQVLRVLRYYDEEMARLKPRWEAVEIDSDVAYLLSQEEALVTAVRKTFWTATKDRNGWHHVRVAGVEDIRRMAKNWLARQHEPGCFYPSNGMPCSCTPRREEI